MAATSTTPAASSAPEAPNSTPAEHNSVYALFLHLRELKRKKKCLYFINVSQTKIKLTDQLIYKVKQRKKQGTISREDREVMWREKDFRKFLRHQVKRREKQLNSIQQKALEWTRSQ